MEAISPLYHLNVSSQRNFTIKFSQLDVAVDSSSSHSSSNVSSICSVKARHAQIMKMPRKRNSDLNMQTLITSYLRFRDFQSAAMVFFVGFEQNYLYWNTFLEDFMDFGGDPCEILQAFAGLHNKGVTFGSETMAVVLKLSAKLRHPWLGLEIHVCLIKRGFDIDVYAKSALMNFYGSCSDLDSANKAFDESSDRVPMLWNEAVLVALRNEKWLDGLNVFRGMQLSSRKADNTSTVARVLQACGKIKALDEGKQIHGYIIRNAMESNLSICNSLINMYSKNGSDGHAKAVFCQMENRNLTTWNTIISSSVGCGNLDNAWELLHQMETYNVKPDIVTWNSLLSGNLHRGSYQEVLTILQHMQNAGFNPNNRSINTVLQAVSELFYLNLGKVIHCFVLRNGLDSDQHVVTSLLDMYVKNDDLDSAQAVFHSMEDKNIFAWNSMIHGYSFKGNSEKAAILMNQMEREGIRPDLVTYNSMVSGYSMTGQTDEALNVIRQMKNSGLTPNIVSWTALISGSCQNGYYKNAFDYCYQMHAEGVKPNSATIASLLRACSGLSDVFQKSDNRTSASWNSMIMGFSKYGHRKEAVSLFKRMQEEKINPDAITMTALLSGCKHSGLIDDGWRFFDSMETEYGITPTIQHYSCMVDLLGRAGYLDEAWDFIGQMPMKPDSTVWGALLGSCRIHGNIHLGEMAAKELFKLEPHNPANYLLLMNMYAASKRWDDVEKVKDLMNHKSVKLGNVWSWIQINKTVNIFSASGKPHPEDGEVYFELYHLVSEIKNLGYLPDTKCVHQNINQEEKETTLLSHTEKRAIVYGLIKTENNTPIRVIKNTTICADCHTFAQYTSLARKRQIILKDGIQFYHFAEGKCSCSESML